jgi:hypothetical protein
MSQHISLHQHITMGIFEHMHTGSVRMGDKRRESSALSHGSQSAPVTDQRPLTQLLTMNCRKLNVRTPYSAWRPRESPNVGLAKETAKRADPVSSVLTFRSSSLSPDIDSRASHKSRRISGVLPNNSGFVWPPGHRPFGKSPCV